MGELKWVYTLKVGESPLKVIKQKNLPNTDRFYTLLMLYT